MMAWGDDVYTDGEGISWFSLGVIVVAFVLMTIAGLVASR